MTTSLSNLSVSQKSEKVVFQCPTGLINWKSPIAEASFAFQFSPLELFHSVASLNELRPCTTLWLHERTCMYIGVCIQHGCVVQCAPACLFYGQMTIEIT